MIARIWRARIDTSRLEDYAQHFDERVIPVLSAVEGYRGAQILCNDEPQPAELVVVTWWSSRAAIQRFAGSDMHRAVIADEARQMLVSFQETVAHYDVIAEHRLPSSAPRPRSDE